MHFYPLFLYDIETAVIPDFGFRAGERHLFLSTSYLDEGKEFLHSLKNQFALHTVNPFDEQEFLSFSVKNKPLPGSVPFVSRSFGLMFDVISCTENGERVYSRFEVFEYNIINVSESKYLSFRVSLVLDVTKTEVSGKVFYEGVLSINGEVKIPGNDDFKQYLLGSFPVRIF